MANDMLTRSNVESFDFPNVDVKFFLDFLREEMRQDMKQGRTPMPILGIGLAGIGKTEGIRGVAKDLGINMLEMRLVNYTETDLIGLPFISADGTHTEHAPNTLFPTEERDGKYGILLIDEFTSAPRNIQVPILQLTDSSRSVGQYRLPDGWKIVITGNGPNDGGTFTGLPGTVISRAGCFYVGPSVSSWLDWAGKNNIHPTIRAYVKYSPKDMHGYIEDDEAGYDRLFPCPRSWTNLSRLLDDFYAAHPNWTRTTETYEENHYAAMNLVASHIGVPTASRFLAFVAYEQDLVDIDQVIKATTPEQRKALPAFKELNKGVQFLTVTGIADRLKSMNNASIIENTPTGPKIKPQFIQAVANCFNWIFDSLSPSGEMATYASAEIMTNIANIAASIVSDPRWAQLCPAYTKLANRLGTGVFRVADYS